MRLTEEQLNKVMKKYNTDRLWSFSRMNLFKTSPYSYYLKYIVQAKEDNDNSIYGVMGGCVHTILEKFYSEDHRLNKIINYHSRNFKSDFWGQPGFRKLSDDEYYDLIGEIVDGPINEYQLPKVFIFLKNGAQTEDFVLNETFKRLIKMSLHFTSSEESKIREWNINFREYCENDFKEFVNYCFTTYPEYDNDNVDLKKLYLLDQTLNGLHQILH